MAFPKRVAGLLRQIMKVDPYVASGGSGEVFPSNALAFFRKIWINTVGVEHLRVSPIHLGGLWIDLESCFLAYCEPFFPRSFLQTCCILNCCGDPLVDDYGLAIASASVTRTSELECLWV